VQLPAAAGGGGLMPAVWLDVWAALCVLIALLVIVRSK
jgi:amino acid permease